MHLLVADEKQEEGEVCLAAGPVPEGGPALWFLDSAATFHMTNNASILEEVRPATTTMCLAHGNKIPAAGLGSTKFHSTNGDGKDVVVKLKQIFHVPTLTGSLLSVNKLCDNRCSVTYDKTSCQIKKDGKVLIMGQRSGNLFHLKPGPQKPPVCEED